MELKFLRQEKEEVEVELNNLTLVELLRAYLNQNPAVTFAAWKRDHPTKNPILLVKTKGKDAKKVISEVISAIVKELEETSKDFKNLK